MCNSRKKQLLKLDCQAPVLTLLVFAQLRNAKNKVAGGSCAGVWSVPVCAHICRHGNKWIYLYFLPWLMSVEAGCTVIKQYYSCLKVRWADQLCSLHVEGLRNFHIKIFLEIALNKKTHSNCKNLCWSILGQDFLK